MSNGVDSCFVPVRVGDRVFTSKYGREVFGRVEKADYLYDAHSMYYVEFENKAIPPSWFMENEVTMADEQRSPYEEPCVLDQLEARIARLEGIVQKIARERRKS
jgi:hypothetical protein